MLKEIVAFLWNTHKTYRTPNTRSLDEKFDLNASFKSSATVNDKNICNMLLSLSKQKGHFVAVPFDTKYFGPYSRWKCSVVDALNMVNQGYLELEKIYPDVLVVSATEKLAEEIYNR